LCALSMRCQNSQRYSTGIWGTYSHPRSNFFPRLILYHSHENPSLTTDMTFESPITPYRPRIPQRIRCYAGSAPRFLVKCDVQSGTYRVLIDRGDVELPGPHDRGLWRGLLARMMRLAGGTGVLDVRAGMRGGFWWGGLERG
jgi:hypothetical protein